MASKIIGDLDLEANAIRLVRPSFLYNTTFKALPGLRYDKKSKSDWIAPLSWSSALMLRATFGEDIEWTEDLNNWLFELRETKIDPGFDLRDATEADLDSDEFDFLRNYQKAGVKFLSTMKTALLADGMGSGKTYTSGASVRYLHEVMGEETLPLLIVCPNSTKRSWKKDLSKIWPGIDIQVVSGTAAKKRKILGSGADVYIINWEGLKGFSKLAPYGSVALKRCPECGGEDAKVKPAQCHVHEKELNKIPFKAIIADEIHRAKDGKSQTTRALRAIAQSSGAEVRFGLSGTPMGNNYDDLWSPLNFILPESYPSKTKYIDYYLDTSYDLWGGLNIVGIKKDKEDEFFLGLDPYMRRMPKELILSELPEKTYETRYVEMTAKQSKAYKQMQEGMIAELEGGVTIATTPLVKMNRLLQLASAYGEVQQIESVDPETGEMKIKEKVILNDTSCKLDAFMDDLPDFEGESVAVFSASKQIINLLSARMEKKKIPHGLITGDQDIDERQFYMDKFQSGDIKFILLTTGAGGTGITLTEGSTAVYLTRPFSMIESSQSEDRVHRIGSEKHDRVRYIDYVTEGTVDEDVIPALQEKDDRLESVLRDKELLRKLIKGEGN